MKTLLVLLFAGLVGMAFAQPDLPDIAATSGTVPAALARVGVAAVWVHAHDFCWKYTADEITTSTATWQAKYNALVSITQPTFDAVWASASAPLRKMILRAVYNRLGDEQVRVRGQKARAVAAFDAELAKLQAWKTLFKDNATSIVGSQ